MISCGSSPLIRYLVRNQSTHGQNLKIMNNFASSWGGKKIVLMYS